MGKYHGSEALRRAVERKLGRPVRDQDWQDAFEAVCGLFGAYHDDDRDKLVDYLRRKGHTARKAPPPPSPRKNRRGKRHTPLQAPTRLAFTYLDGDVQQEVRKFWRKHWGTEEPPFPGDLAAAARWIEEEAAKLGPVPPLSAEDRRTLHEIKNRTCYTISYWARELRYWVPGKGDSGVCRVPGRGTLAHLWWVAQQVQKVLDCRAEDATTYVLTGKIPFVPPLRCQPSWIVDTSEGSLGLVTLQIASPDVTPEEVAEAYQRARRRLWGQSRSTPPTDADVALVQFALATGGVPWEERRRRWNREHPDHRVEDRDTLRKRVKRAFRRVLKPPSW